MQEYDKTAMYKSEVVADSVSPEGIRLTSLETTLPRMVLAEFNTHRTFSRNSASSRAIPVEKQLARAVRTPYIPLEWGALQPGMQSERLLNLEEQLVAEDIWLKGRDEAVIAALGLNGGIRNVKNEELQQELYELLGTKVENNLALSEVGLHKQFTNRLLEPYMWHTVLSTATEWDNFYGQRLGKSAQPEIRMAATLMREAFDTSEPRSVAYGGWHLPYIKEHEFDLASEEDLVKVASGRSARLSYLTQNNPRPLEKDIELHDDLIDSGHMSPLEHVATPFSKLEWEGIDKLKAWNSQNGVEGLDKNVEFDGNFRGWHQWRKMQPDEDNFTQAIVNRALDE